MLMLPRYIQCEALTIWSTVIMRDLKLPHEEPGPFEAQLDIKDLAKQSS